MDHIIEQLKLKHESEEGGNKHIQVSSFRTFGFSNLTMFSYLRVCESFRLVRV